MPSLAQAVRDAAHRAARPWTFGLAALLLVASQAAVITRPPVNQEFVFVEAGAALAWPAEHGERLDYFWANQANPLGYPLAVAAIDRITGSAGSVALARLPSILGALLILAAGWTIAGPRRAGAARCLVWSLAVVSHPMIWLYTNQSTADVLPTGLVCLAAACALRGGRWHVPGVALLAAACVTKWNTALLGPLFVVLAHARWRSGKTTRGRALLVVAAYGFVAAGVLGLHLWLVSERWGVWIFSDRFERDVTLQIAPIQWGMQALVYAVFLGLFLGLYLGPLVELGVGAWRARARWPIVAAAAGAAAVGWSLVARWRSGEMDFGGLAASLPAWALPATIAAALALGVVIVAGVGIALHGPTRGSLAVVLAAIATYVVLSAATRPAQRYLILVLPMALWWLLVEARTTPLRRLLRWAAPMMALTTALCVVGEAYLWAQGEAAAAMGRWIVAHDLQRDTTPDALMASHAGNVFPVAPPATARYAVLTLPPEAIAPQGRELHRERTALWGRALWDQVLVDTAPAD